MAPGTELEYRCIFQDLWSPQKYIFHCSDSNVFEPKYELWPLEYVDAKLWGYNDILTTIFFTCKDREHHGQKNHHGCCKLNEVVFKSFPHLRLRRYVLCVTIDRLWGQMGRNRRTTIIALNWHGERNTLHSTVAVHSYTGLTCAFVPHNTYISQMHGFCLCTVEQSLFLFSVKI